MLPHRDGRCGGVPAPSREWVRSRKRKEAKEPAISLGKTWERTPNSKNRIKSHRINGPSVLLRAHNPKVVSSNLTPATNFCFMYRELVTTLTPDFFFQGPIGVQNS